MVLPVDYNTVTITGRYVYLDGTPAVGTVRFTGKVVATSGATNTVILPSTVVANLDVDGAFTVQLPATDDPDVLPNNWTYSVEERFNNGGGRKYDIDVPVSATSIDLSEVAPVTPASGDPTAFVTLTTFEDHVNTGTEAASVDWANVLNKPGTFPPSTHVHPESEITGLTDDLAGKAPLSHTHVSTHITDFNEAVDDRVAALLTPGTNITFTYDDTAGTFTINSAGGGGTGSGDMLLNPTSTQTLVASATRTWSTTTAPYSSGDTNVDQFVYKAGHPTGGADIKTFWLNGNNEGRASASTPSRVAFRVFETPESAGQGPSTGDVFQVSTNPTSAASREPLAAVRGTGASSLPGYLVLSRGIDAPNLKPGSWQDLSLLNGVTASAAPYDSPQARLEYPDVVRLKGRIEIPASTASFTNFFQLPTGLRPSATKVFSIRTGPGSNLATIMEIDSSGYCHIIVSSGSSASYIGLDGIVFTL